MEQQLVSELGQVRQQRSIYGTDYLIPFMETNKLRQLERLFQQAQDNITAERFIEICAQFLHFPRLEKEEFIHGLLQFFKSIDMDGSGTLSWSEFTQFLIDNFDQSKHRSEEGLASDIVNRVHNHQDKHYVRSRTKQDTETRGNGVEKVQSDHRNRVHVLEKKCARLKIISEDPEEPLRVVSVVPEKLHIVTFCWSQSEGKHCLIGSDMSFYFVDSTVQNPLLCKFYYDLLQSQVWYGQQLGCWITTGSDGKIRLWKFQKYSKEEVEQNLAVHTSIHRNQQTKRRVLEGHTDTVTCVIQLRSPKCLASCGQDGRILLWDLDTFKILSQFKHNESHPRYLRGLEYNPWYQHLLLSYGFEQQAKLWCPEHSMSRPYVKALEGHHNSILLAKFVPCTRYCLTVDQRHCMRLWDLQNYSLMQLISCEQVPLHDLCFLGQDVFVLASKRLLFYDNVQNRSIKQQLDQEVYACDLLYSQFFNVLLVFTKVDTRFYDGRTGRLCMVQNSVSGQSRGKELIAESKKLLAVVDGRLEQFNLKHFSKIDGGDSPYDKHQIEQKNLTDTTLLCVDEFNLLLVGDQQSRITYRHFSKDGEVQLKILVGGHRNSPVVCLHRQENVLVSGSRNGIVTLREFCTGRYLDHFELQCESIESATLCFHVRLVVVRCSDALYIVGEKMLRLPNCRCLEIVGDEKCYVSDNKGNIRIYDLTDVLDAVGALTIETEQVERKVLNRREQLDCEKQLKDINTKETISDVAFRLCINAHRSQITVLRWIDHQGGLVSASIDKTIKVWSPQGSGLVLQSTLHLIHEDQTSWKFPKQIILNEIKLIQESLKFIEESEGTSLDKEEKLTVTRRLLRKIFSDDYERQENNFLAETSHYEKSRKDSDLLDGLVICKELGKVRNEIEITEKKLEIRSKVERLTKSKHVLMQEVASFSQKCRFDERSQTGEGNRKKIYITDCLSSVSGQFPKPRKSRKLQRVASSTHKLGRQETSLKYHADQSTAFQKETEGIRRTYQHLLQRPSSTIATRPATAQTLPRTCIRDVKCQHNSSWKRLVRFDSSTHKWTALSRML